MDLASCSNHLLPPMRGRVRALLATSFEARAARTRPNGRPHRMLPASGCPGGRKEECNEQALPASGHWPPVGGRSHHLLARVFEICKQGWRGLTCRVCFDPFGGVPHSERHRRSEPPRARTAARRER
jgi:hypothetical protein